MNLQWETENSTFRPLSSSFPSINGRRKNSYKEFLGKPNQTKPEKKKKIWIENILVIFISFSLLAFSLARNNSWFPMVFPM